MASAMATAAAANPQVDEEGKPLSRHGSYESMRGAKHSFSWKMILLLAYDSVGIVYGDIGTSPLYVYASTFTKGLTHEDDLIGALSLILWALTMSPLIKYMWVVLFCDDNGEGGTFALYSLICRHIRMSTLTRRDEDDHDLSSFTLLELPGGDGSASQNENIGDKLKAAFEKSKALQFTVLSIVLLATCMVIGDGVLTPAQSVLSAVGGIQVSDSTLSQNVVVLVSLVILALLFLGQPFGTHRIGFTFAPIVIVWLLSIAGIGVYNIFKFSAWRVFKALSPHYGILFLTRNGQRGWIQLGGIFLTITGTEATFADLGHFTALPIQLAFSTFVYPCLMLAYIGQAAWLTENMDLVGLTFYKSIPKPVYWPMFIVATAAAVVASQAMITATFSIVRQSMNLGCFPAVKVVHTSDHLEGQIYIPEINLILAVLTLLVAGIMGQQGTTTIGNAYGIAVCTTMLITTQLVTIVLLSIKRKPPAIAFLFYGFFTVFEAVYLSSNLYKIPNGGWVPIVFAVTFFTVMAVWRYASVKKQTYEREHKLSLEWTLDVINSPAILRPPGIAVFYSDLPRGVPVIFSHFLESIPAINKVLVFMFIKHVEVPYVPEHERFKVRRLGPLSARMYRCTARYGYADNSSKEASFTSLLNEALVDYVRLEDPAKWKVTKESSPSSNEADGNGDGKPMPDITAAAAAMGAVVPTSFDEVEKLREEEIAIINDSIRDNGVISIVGKTELRSKGGSLGNFILIDHVYYFLKANTRDSAAALNIPTKKILFVGMTYEV